MKKKFFLTSIYLYVSFLPMVWVVAQATQVAEPSAALEVNSKSQGFLPPRMSTQERDAIQSPAEGLILYNETTDQLEIYDANANTWGAVDSSSGINVATDLPTSNIKKGDAYLISDYLWVAGADGGSWKIFESGLFHNGFWYKIVESSDTGKIWLDRNLGATRVAQSSTDHLAYGELYQWGRATDGHEKITWMSGTSGSGTNTITITLSSSDTPNNGGLFITIGTSPGDWRASPNDNLWQNGLNDPCPDGFRIPTETELNNELAGWSHKNAAGAFGSSLKLPIAGNRSRSDGEVNFEGSIGYYWTSTTNNTGARNLSINSSNASFFSNYRAFGYSIRCIKE